MKVKFEFMNSGEFGNPFYVVYAGNVIFAKIIFAEGYWYAGFVSQKHGVSSDTLITISEKIKELNESLEQQRKEYFGLI